MSNFEYTFVVLGGGIAGVTCAETLAQLNRESDILLITRSEMIKTVSSAVYLTKTIMELDVEETTSSKISDKYPNVKFLTDNVTKLNYDDRIIETENKLKISFKKLCICTGGEPNLIKMCNPYVIGIRDTESVKDFESKIKNSKRIMVVGNGGIASEVIYEVEGIEKIWVIKDNYITKNFIDPGAAEFFQNKLDKKCGDASSIIKRVVYTTTTSQNSSDANLKKKNPALGPDWHKRYDLKGSLKENSVAIEYNTRVENIITGDENYPVYVELTNGKRYGVDFVVSATGVVPNSEIFVRDNKDLKISEDGGIIVDWKMETTLKDVFAAGDVCSAGWTWAQHWHQMRLWTQAQQMGCYGAKCMTASVNNEEIYQDFCFEMFSHVTKLYGHKVILLGLYNGQKLENDYEVLLRVTRDKEYVKLVIKNGKMQGALLIGDTDLEEMCENLILNQLDLTQYGDDLLNPDIDIDDYFD